MTRLWSNSAMQLSGCLLRARLRRALAARTPAADCNVGPETGPPQTE